ncbi:MAG: hypothetical protein ACK5YR_08770 [Pirellula sp.]
MITIPIALFGWPIFVFCLGFVTRLQLAIVVSYFGAWLFLPMASYNFTALLPYDKWTAATLGSLACSVVLGGDKLFSWRPSWVDLPMIAWCLSPMLSNTFGGYGPYEGLCGVSDKTLQWVIPYLLGRSHFRDHASLLFLAKSFLIAGLIYLPLCWYEIRMSPQLHSKTYGMFQHEWHQLMRGGGFRPIVYMQHAIAVSTFICITLSIGWWLWRTGKVTKVFGMPMWALLPLTALTMIGCKTMNAIFLFAISLGIYCAVLFLRWRWSLALAVIVPLFYMAGKLTGLLDDNLLLSAARAINSERADSLEQRLYSERVMIDGMKGAPLFGNGRWADAIQFAEQDEGRTIIPDAYWIIVAGSGGLFGLASYIGLFMVPVLSITRRSPREGWLSNQWAAVSALTVAVGLYYLDCLMNAMLSSVFPLILGALTTVAATKEIDRADESLRMANMH